MPNTVEHEPLVAPHPDALTVRYTTNPDGWVTAQLVEVPEAISQGRDDAEAFANVLAALYDLTHVPTGAERIANTIQARLIEPVFVLLRR